MAEARVIQQTPEFKLYQKIRAKDLSFSVFATAYEGWQHLKHKRKLGSILGIVDFNQASNAPRLYIIDLAKAKLVQQSIVTHGKKSGYIYPEQFSNTPKSNQSSLGFYHCQEHYQGKHGLSMRLNGLEPGVNDNARSRGIVMHQSLYADHSFVKQHGYAGRSLGCFALPSNSYQESLRLLQGNLLFAHHPSHQYNKQQIKQIS